MTDQNPTPATSSQPTDSPTSRSGYVPPTPGRCLRGAAISGGLAFAMYSLTHSIIQVLAGVPLPTKSTFAANIAVAVRTLVIGVATLATAIFTIAAVGLVALSIQLLIRQAKAEKS